MGYTNSTTNYHLPQFIGTDKPSWLGDVNSAMSAIDTQMKVNADDIDSLEARMTATETVANSASSNATTALTNAQTAQTTADSASTAATNAANAAANAQTTANAAQTAASTADGKAVSAQTTATTALTKANANESAIANFNLTTYETPTNVTASSGSATSTLQVAKNSDGSLAKIYGNIVFNNWVVSGDYIMLTASFQTSLRPTSAFTIKNACFTVIINSNNQQTVNWRDLTVNTDGTCTTTGFGVFNDTLSAYVVLPPMLYWIKDFGDTPESPTP